MNTLFFTSEEINLNPRASWGELLQIAFINKEQYFSISRLAYEEELYFEYNEQTQTQKDNYFTCSALASYKRLRHWHLTS